MTWNESVKEFIIVAHQEGLRMLMVGGGAVNWHGYRRHSADVDFWIETTAENLRVLVKVLQRIGLEVEELPPAIHQQLQNVSLKFSPYDLDVELITRFSVDRSFEAAYADRVLVEVDGEPYYKWSVLSYDDLIVSKLKAGRAKDLLDIQELKRIRKER